MKKSLTFPFLGLLIGFAAGALVDLFAYYTISKVSPGVSLQFSFIFAKSASILGLIIGLSLGLIFEKQNNQKKSILMHIVIGSIFGFLLFGFIINFFNNNIFATIFNFSPFFITSTITGAFFGAIIGFFRAKTNNNSNLDISNKKYNKNGIIVAIFFNVFIIFLFFFILNFIKMGNAFTPFLLILFISIEVLSFAYFRKNKSVVSGLSLSFIVSALLFIVFVLVLFGIIFRFGGFSWGF